MIKLGLRNKSSSLHSTFLGFVFFFFCMSVFHVDNDDIIIFVWFTLVVLKLVILSIFMRYRRVMFDDT